MVFRTKKRQDVEVVMAGTAVTTTSRGRSLTRKSQQHRRKIQEANAAGAGTSPEKVIVVGNRHHHRGRSRDNSASAAGFGGAAPITAIRAGRVPSTLKQQSNGRQRSRSIQRRKNKSRGRDVERHRSSRSVVKRNKQRSQQRSTSPSKKQQQVVVRIRTRSRSRARGGSRLRQHQNEQQQMKLSTKQRIWQSQKEELERELREAELMDEYFEQREPDIIRWNEPKSDNHHRQGGGNSDPPIVTCQSDSSLSTLSKTIDPNMKNQQQVEHQQQRVSSMTKPAISCGGADVVGDAIMIGLDKNYDISVVGRCSSNVNGAESPAIENFAPCGVTEAAAVGTTAPNVPNWLSSRIFSKAQSSSPRRSAAAVVAAERSIVKVENKGNIKQANNSKGKRQQQEQEKKQHLHDRDGDDTFQEDTEENIELVALEKNGGYRIGLVVGKVDNNSNSKKMKKKKNQKNRKSQKKPDPNEAGRLGKQRSMAIKKKKNNSSYLRTDTKMKKPNNNGGIDSATDMAIEVSSQAPGIQKRRTKTTVDLLSGTGNNVEAVSSFP